MPAHSAHSHLISISVNLSTSLLDSAVKKSRPRKLNMTLQQSQEGYTQD